jgi:hypothetical protein
MLTDCGGDMTDQPGGALRDGVNAPHLTSGEYSRTSPAAAYA